MRMWTRLVFESDDFAGSQRNVESNFPRRPMTDYRAVFDLFCPGGKMSSVRLNGSLYVRYSDNPAMF